MFGVCKIDQSIPIEHLDYKFIGSCKDVELLQKLVKILRSGEEGIYPDLTHFAEEQLRKFSPKNPLLEKVNPEKSTSELGNEEQQNIVNDLKGFTKDTKTLQNGNKDNLPPVRNSKTLNVDADKENKPEVNQKSHNKRVTPRSYDEWSKLDKEIENSTNEDDIASTKGAEAKMNNTGKGSLKPDEMIGKLNTKDLTIEELAEQAEKEKNKGNEAFRSGDYKEALVYYNRSIELSPAPAVHNNRAMAYIKLEEYEKAIIDCNCVLKDESNNIKAFLRRGLAYQALKKLELALKDFTMVVEIEPKNKRGKELYESVYKELEKQKDSGAKKKGGGKRLVVEEIESTQDEGDGKTTEPMKKSSGNRIVIEEVDNVSVPVKEVSQDRIQPTEEAPETVEVKEQQQIQEPTLESTPSTDGSETQNNITNPPSFEGTTPAPPPPVVHKELPQDALKWKNEGNYLYKNGQYQEAYQKYTFAIQILMDDVTGYKTALSSLFNNRAICQLKSGNCSECTKDCTKSLKYLANIKAIQRRATAYETLEKYKDAYADFQIVYSRTRDPKVSQAMSRISNHLKSDYGRDWHDKLPARDALDWNDAPASAITSPPVKSSVQEEENTKQASTVEDQSPALVKQANNNIASQTKPAVAKEEKKPEIKPVEVKHKVIDQKPGEKPQPKQEKTIQEQFVETKEKGNSFVKQAKYSEAIPFYTQCISLLPSEVPSYTNRALCYLKVKEAKPLKAVEDCTQALKLQPGNIKALFRRAQGYRMLKKYKEALGDLASILKEEPKNKAAQKDMDECKDLYRTELREMQSKAQQSSSSTKKSGKKMKIEEVTSDTLASNKPPTKQSTKNKTCPLAKGSTTPSSTSKSSTTNSNKKINAVEFMQMWNGIKSGKSSEYAEIMRQIEPTKLPELLSNKLDGKILENFVWAISDHFTSKENYKYGMTLLKSMHRVQRFSTMLMFLGTQEKTLLKSSMDTLESRAKQDGCEKTVFNEISQLRSQYRCSPL